MKEKINILKTFNIEANEAAPVFLLIVQSIFLGIFYGTFDIGAHTLFLKTFPEDMIPKAYILSGIAGIIMTSIFSRYQSKIRFSSLAKYTLLIIALLTILVRIFFELSDAKWTIFVVFLLLGPLNILAILAFWGTVSRIFTLRQGKRLFGIIDSGQVFGIIISSYAIPLIISHLNGTKNLLIISAASIFIGMLIEMIIAKTYNLDESATEIDTGIADEKEQVKLRHFTKNPYILYMALFVIFSMFTAFFVQYSFLVVTNEQYPVEDDLAKFLGFFTGSMMIFTFAIKTFVYSKLMKTYGLKISLMLSSVLLIIFTGLAIGVGLISGYELGSAGFIYFFLLISLGKLFNKTLKDALEVPSFKLLYQSLKKSIRFDVQAKIDGTINEISALVSGLLLGGLGLLSFIKLIHFSVFLFALLAIWSFITLKLYKEYRKSLEETLKADNTKDELKNKQSISESIKADPLLISRKLDDYKAFAPDLYLPSLINLFNSNTELDLNLVSKSHLIEWYLYSTLNKTDLKIQWPELLPISKDTSVKEIAKKLSSDEPTAYLSSISHLINLKSKDRNSLLLALLRIPDVLVQQIAIRISGTMQEVELTNTLAEFLDSRFVKSDAIISLKQMAPKSLKQLIQMFYKTDVELNNQLALMDIVGQVESTETIQFLLENINHHKKEIRNKAIELLKMRNYTANEKDYPRLFHAITQAAQDVSWDISALAAFTGSAANKALYQALHFEFLNHQNILMQLLAIAYDSQSVDHVKDHLESGTSEGVGYALELFDLFLSEEIKPFILVIFEDLTFIEKSRLLENFFPVKIPELDDLIIQIINRDPNLISNTTKKLALYEYTNYYKQLTDDLIAQVFNPEHELQALSAHIVKNINPAKYSQLKQRLKPIARKNIENTRIDENFPIQTVLTNISEQLQTVFQIKPTDFIDFFNQVTIYELDAIKNKSRKDQVINYFVFLIYNQNGNSINESISRLFNNFDLLQTETGLVIGITKEAMNNLMLTNKQIAHSLMNLI